MRNTFPFKQNEYRGSMLSLSEIELATTPTERARGMCRSGGAEADTPAAARILPFDGLTFTGDVAGATFKAVLI
jgi:hypothetical protein